MSSSSTSSENNENVHIFKVALVGEGGVGKTTFVKRHATGEFQKGYLATVGVEVRPICFETNYGRICFSVWDIAGQEKFRGLSEGYYAGADAALVMFDLTSRATYKKADYWISHLRETREDIPIVVCGNKLDAEDKMKLLNVKYLRRRDTHYYSISAKSNFNFEKPFLDLARTLTGKKDLVFV